MKWIYTMLLLFFGWMALAQSDTTSVTFTFVGDVMGHDAQIEAAYQETTQDYDYSETFHYISPHLSSADFTMANLEVTLGVKPYKGYPLFSSPPALASALKNAGVDVLLTANNHSCDRRKSGILQTINILDSLQIAHTGTFRNASDKVSTQPLILEKNGIRVALLNYTYGTNGIPATAPTIVNLIDKTEIAQAIGQAKKAYVDKIIIFMHWGAEYKFHPSAEQVELYDFCKANGADIVIGAHPHVLQPMERSNDGFVAYSLGNFVSNQRKRYTDGGALLHLELSKSGTNTWVSQAHYQLTWVYMPTVNQRNKYYILPASEYEKQEAFFMGLKDYEAMMLFLNDSRTLLNKFNKSVPEKAYSVENNRWEIRK